MMYRQGVFSCLQSITYYIYCVPTFLPELHSESEKKSQIESLKLEISSLKEQIARQQQDLQAKTAQVGKNLESSDSLILVVSIIS